MLAEPGGFAVALLTGGTFGGRVPAVAVALASAVDEGGGTATEGGAATVVVALSTATCGMPGEAAADAAPFDVGP